jgi:hypothetical protein
LSQYCIQIKILLSYIPEKKILLLLGGNKNGQSKDISKAKKYLPQGYEIPRKERQK